MSDLLPTMDAIARLNQRMDRMNEHDLSRARETMRNLVKNVQPDDWVRLMIAHHSMVGRLRDILRAWHTNKLIIQQGIEQAKAFGDQQEEDRLSGRLAGIVLLYEQIQAALNTRNQAVRRMPSCPD